MKTHDSPKAALTTGEHTGRCINLGIPLCKYDLLFLLNIFIAPKCSKIDMFLGSKILFMSKTGVFFKCLLNKIALKQVFKSKMLKNSKWYCSLILSIKIADRLTIKKDKPTALFICRGFDF